MLGTLAGNSRLGISTKGAYSFPLSSLLSSHGSAQGACPLWTIPDIFVPAFDYALTHVYHKPPLCLRTVISSFLFLFFFIHTDLCMGSMTRLHAHTHTHTHNN